MNRMDRLLAMIVFLQGRRLTRAEDMAEHFEISLRTVYRDLAALGEAGVPVVGEAGVGYSLLKGYHLPPVMFSREEAAALFVAGELASRFTDASVRQPVEAALRKIRAILPRSGQDFVSRLENRLGILVRQEHGRAWLSQLEEAVAGHQALRLQYRDAERKVSQRDVEPSGLLYYRDRWHLIAWCRLREEQRDFRTDRIEALELLEERFTPKEEFRAEDYMGKGELDESVCHEVRLTVPRWSVDGLKAEWRIRVLEERDGPEGCTITLLTPSLEGLAHWLLGLGTGITVHHPADLRANVRKVALEMAQRHEESAEILPMNGPAQ